MIDKILRLIGLVRYSQIDNVLASESSVELIDKRFDSVEFEEIKERLRKIPGLPEFLDWTISQDIKRFYHSQDSEHPMIRGAISRTRYIRSLCKEDVKLPINRYGV